MSHIVKEVIDLVGKEVEFNGYISIDKSVMREILPYSDRHSYDGLAEEIAGSHDYYYDVDEDNGLFHFSKDKLQRSRAKEISTESELTM